VADRRVVYSTGDGDLRKAREPKSRAGGDGRVRVRRETSGRRGKTVTTVSGVPDDVVRDVAGRLKKRCGVGGSVKDGVIELQGDHRNVVMDVLRGEGYDVVAAGG
jgi:translation initiation factor 1